MSRRKEHRKAHRKSLKKLSRKGRHRKYDTIEEQVIDYMFAQAMYLEYKKKETPEYVR